MSITDSPRYWEAIMHFDSLRADGRALEPLTRHAALRGRRFVVLMRRRIAALDEAVGHDAG